MQQHVSNWMLIHLRVSRESQGEKLPRLKGSGGGEGWGPGEAGEQREKSVPGVGGMSGTHRCCLQQPIGLLSIYT